MASTAWMRRLVAVVVAPTLLTLGGCGGTPDSPADAVPELASTLGRVDDALAAGRTQAARRQLEALTEATIEARDVGDLEEAEADRILAAATRLLALLPEPTPEPEPDSGSDSEPEPTTPSPTPKGQERDERDRESGGEDEEDAERDEDDKDRDKGRGNDKKDEDGGHDPDPDDGHGN